MAEDDAGPGWRVARLDLTTLTGSSDTIDWVSRATSDPDCRVWDASDQLRVLLHPAVPMHPVFATWAFSLRRQRRTVDAYSSDMKQFLNYLQSRRLAWSTVSARDIENYLEWRRYSVEWQRSSTIRVGVGPSTVSRNRSALSSFYDHAVRQGWLQASPVAGSPRANYLKGRKMGDANWLTRRAYERWRAEALGGQGTARQESMMMVVRNQAYADLLYGSGLRLSEGAGLLTFEVPKVPVVGRLYKGRVPAALAKGRVRRGRLFYLNERYVQTVHGYLNNDRTVEEAFGLQSGRYERDGHALIVQKLHRRNDLPEAVTLLDASNGAIIRERLDELTEDRRARLYAIDDRGRRRPLWLWLSHGGAAFQPSNWWEVFHDGFERMERAQPSGLGLLDQGAAIYVNPRMLRHSFALHAFTQASLIELRRSSDVTERGLRRLIAQTNIWARVQQLLGHANVETTRKHYLEPVQAMDWDWFASSSDQAPEQLDEAMALIASNDDRVFDIPDAVIT